MASETHIIALVKGTAEGDPERHFGGLMLTEAGRTFYKQWCLGELPGGRANNWHGTIYDAAVDRVRMLLKQATNRG